MFDLLRVRVQPILASAVAPVSRWTRGVSHSLGAGGALDNARGRVEELHATRERVDLFVHRLSTTVPAAA